MRSIAAPVISREWAAPIPSLLGSVGLRVFRGQLIGVEAGQVMHPRRPSVGDHTVTNL
jgi:hypothetical protein